MWKFCLETWMWGYWCTKFRRHLGAFSTSTSNFLGEIQSTIIDTSYTSILTCYYNNEDYFCKMLSRLCPPPPSKENPSWGWVPPSPVHQHEEAPMQCCCNFFIFGQSLICSLVGAFVLILLPRGVASFWCQVCFGPPLLYIYIFRVQIRQACWARAILDIFELETVYSLNFW